MAEVKVTTAEHDLTLDDVEVSTGESLLLSGAATRFCRLVNEAAGDVVIAPENFSLDTIVTLLQRAKEQELIDTTVEGVVINMLQFDWRKAAEETGRTVREVFEIVSKFAEIVAAHHLLPASLHLVEEEKPEKGVTGVESAANPRQGSSDSLTRTTALSDGDFYGLPRKRALGEDTRLIFGDDRLPRDAEVTDPVDRVLCEQVDPEIFFPEKGGTAKFAKQVCRVCEIQVQCLEDALDRGQRFGIWGGKTERERNRILQKRKKAGVENGEDSSGDTPEQQEPITDPIEILASLVNVDDRNYDDVMVRFRSDDELHRQFLTMLLDQYEVYRKGGLRPDLKVALFERLTSEGNYLKGVPQALNKLRKYIEELSVNGIGVVDEILDVILGYQSALDLSEIEEAV